MKNRISLAELCLFVIVVCTISGSSLLAKPAVQGGCPSIQALGNFLTTNEVSVSFADDGTGTGTDNYFFTGTPNGEVINPNPPDIVPGLIQYCVYPSGGTEPESGDADYDSWVFGVPNNAALGWFGFGRPDGNPSNLPFDSNTYQVGHASWGIDPITFASLAPTDQTILLHINNPDVCTALYGSEADGSPTNTCFVFPGNTTVDHGCPGDQVACKDVIIVDADGNIADPDHLQLFTNYFLTYNYLISNTTGKDMIFKYPPSKNDVNNGGGKDYFGCEQTPDPDGSPGDWGTYYSNAQIGGLTWSSTFTSNGWKLSFEKSKGACNQSRFFMTPFASTVTLPADGQITFSMDMMLRVNKGGNQEFTSCGVHYLNSGFTIKWFEPAPPVGDGKLHSFTTNPVLSVNVDCPE